MPARLCAKTGAPATVRQSSKLGVGTVMVRIRTVGLALVAAFAFSAVASASASALVWELNGSPITESMKVTSEGTLELEDSKTLVGKSKVKCTGTDAGTVGLEGTDTITAVTVTSCSKVEGGCESEITAAAVHLPWDTKLVTVENPKTKAKEVRDEIKTSGAGTPGWSVTCKTLLGKKTDTCEGETTVGIDNVTKGTHKGDVAALFDEVSREKPATCSEKKEKSGFVYGTNFIIPPAGSTLTATEAKEVEL
jgi:hypothetical protein